MGLCRCAVCRFVSPLPGFQRFLSSMPEEEEADAFGHKDDHSSIEGEGEMAFETGLLIEGDGFGLQPSIQSQNQQPPPKNPGPEGWIAGGVYSNGDDDKKKPQAEHAEPPPPFPQVEVA